MESILSPSPLQPLRSKFFDRSGVDVCVKRDDLIHAQVQGNKWRKLKHNIAEARQLNNNTLLTFGGAFSNHIYAVAATAKYFSMGAVGIIRGAEPALLSNTLQFAREQGMKLHFVSREEYEHKEDIGFVQSLRDKYGPFFLVPEGGTNTLALKGVSEIINELDADFDYLCTACGTGGTIAGLVAGLKGKKKVLGFSALKGQDTLTDAVNRLVYSYCGHMYDNFSINFDYHFGGYAKTKSELIEFIVQFKQEFDITTEPVYTGKMFYGLFDLISKGYFTRGTRIIALHTGGLQGLSGFPELQARIT